MSGGRMKYKLVAFDMDGTLLEGDSCWGVLHRHFGTQGLARKNLRAYERGDIDYHEFMRRDISLWKPTPHISQIERVLGGFELKPNVAEVVARIHEKGYQIVMITGGLDLLAEKVASTLGVEHVLANGLEVDEEGHLTGGGIFRVEPCLKHEVLDKLARKLGFTLRECVAVGDSKHDVNFLKHAGLGVAIGADSELVKVADVVIRDFPRLLDHL